MRAAAPPRLEKLRNSLCYSHAHMCIAGREGGQRVLEVSDEVSLAAAACACAAAAHARACDFSLIWTESGLSWGQMSSLSASAARSVMCSHRAKKTSRLPGKCSKKPQRPGFMSNGLFEWFLQWFRRPSHVILAGRTVHRIERWIIFTPSQRNKLMWRPLVFYCPNHFFFLCCLIGYKISK